MNTTLLQGNTYPVRNALFNLGGKWNAVAKGWEIPNEKIEEARQLVLKGSPRKQPKRQEDRYISNIFQVGDVELYRNKKGRCEDAPCCGCCNC
jgi:hypothetical protein